VTLKQENINILRERLEETAAKAGEAKAALEQLELAIEETDRELAVSEVDMAEEVEPLDDEDGGDDAENWEEDGGA
jgi:DNA polymerase III delta prime subunit